MTKSAIQLPLPIEGATIEIPLTQGKTTIVDAIDSDLAEFYWQAAFCPEYSGNGKYRARRIVGGKKRSNEFLHRVILSRMLGRKLLSHELVDHIDTDPLNNQRSNLRLATPSLNNANQNRRRDNTSGFKGVVFSKWHQKWLARIQVNGKSFHLGCFETREEAAIAYQKAADSFFGEFARYE